MSILARWLVGSRPRTLLVGLLLITLLTPTVLTPQPAAAAPTLRARIRWLTPAINLALAPGETREVTVVYRASQPIDEATLQWRGHPLLATDSLSAVLTGVQPSVEYSATVTLTVQPRAKPRSRLIGTISLHVGRHQLNDPLRVAITVAAPAGPTPSPGTGPVVIGDDEGRTMVGRTRQWFAWSAERIDLTLAPGESRTVPVWFRSDRGIEGAMMIQRGPRQVTVDPNPMTFGNIVAGDDYRVDVTVTLSDKTRIGAGW